MRHLDREFLFGSPTNRDQLRTYAEAALGRVEELERAAGSQNREDGCEAIVHRLAKLEERLAPQPAKEPFLAVVTHSDRSLQWITTLRTNHAGVRISCWRRPPHETPAPFPFVTMFQNGARRRSEDLPRRKGKGQMQRQNHLQFAALCDLPLVGPEPYENLGVDKTS
jgi:hypothetical protein